MTWLTSSAPEGTVAVNICLRQVPMMSMKSREHASDDFRAYLGHTEAVAIDFRVVLWAKVRILSGHGSLPRSWK